MRLPSTFSLSTYFQLMLYMLALTITGCSLEKKSKLNRGLQNLTARYNILFNANELLKEKQAGYAAGYPDDYNELLSVYQDTASLTPEPDKDLELVKQKANTIISIKEQSHYIGDAYLVLGKAYYLEGNFFDAAEYFSYVARSFPEDAGLKQEAMVWKARSLLHLNNLAEARLVTDTALQNISLKNKTAADVYAARLQFDINIQNYTEAEEMATQAIRYCKEKMQAIRWTFILGQLQELNLKPAAAASSYTRVINSNANFDMAFNANLNRIRMEDSPAGVKTTRLARLRSLLKNPDNKDFTDQVYYQIAQLQYAGKDIDNAIKSYKLSAGYSIKNTNQKGLSYLRLANIYFKDKAGYTQAKMYYDSTLLYLSPNYPGFTDIQKKSGNLQLLTDRSRLIAFEDTLQVLASFNETARSKRIDEMVNRYTLQQETITPATADNNNDPFGNDPAIPRASAPNGSKFYFYNAIAIGQGLQDFGRVWGNRKLEDNWRRGNRISSSPAGSNLSTAQINPDPDNVAGPDQNFAGQVNAANYRQNLLQNLPLTPALLAQSNLRIYNAYLDIANFYRDVLDDKKEAIEGYELLLNRFPDHAGKPALYYNLYRLYSGGDIALADKYKNLLLRDYPWTPFSKIILDPGYNTRVNDEDTGMGNLYNQVYDLYADKQYTQAIKAANALLGRYPDNRFAAQLLYLKAFAAGHQEKLLPFKNELQVIVNKYPADQLITPLVNQHLTYISANEAELAARTYVLSDRDNADAAFTLPVVYKQQTEYRIPFTGSYETLPDVRTPDKSPLAMALQTKNQDPARPLVPVDVSIPRGTVLKNKIADARTAPSVFNLRDSSNYYFVISVSSGTTNLASSRFGIGQFNRVNFEGNTITHQLRYAGPDNQLIYVGRFNNLANVKDYARAIIPLLPGIMKVQKDKYSFFIITKENLDKLAGQRTLDSYVDYYQINY